MKDEPPLAGWPGLLCNAQYMMEKYQRQGETQRLPKESQRGKQTRERRKKKEGPQPMNFLHRSQARESHARPGGDAPAWVSGQTVRFKCEHAPVVPVLPCLSHSHSHLGRPSFPSNPFSLSPSHLFLSLCSLQPQRWTTRPGGTPAQHQARAQPTRGTLGRRPFLTCY